VDVWGTIVGVAESERRPRRPRRATPATYRRRRLGAVVAALAVIVVVVLAVRGGGGTPSGLPTTPEQAHRLTLAQHPVHLQVEASGDLLIHSPVWERALALGGGHYDFAPLFREIKPYVAGADLALCHVETPMTPAPPTSYPIFNTPPELAAGIKATGWDACDTASNHSVDQGQAGIDDTGKALDRAGVEHTGSFPSPKAQKKIVFLESQGVKVAFLAYTTDTNGIPIPSPWSVNIASAGRILADAKRATAQGADAVIVNLHWGGEILPEYQVEPSSGQLALVKKLTASPNVTAIVGQGPHAVQPIERINDKYVVFSEGNLISNQSPEAALPASSQDGLVALLDLVVDGAGARVEGVRYVPVWVRHPDYEVLPVGPALQHGEADAASLRASYQRTVSAAGRGKGIEPIPRKLH
jgi:poly-gamma-glutamate capsule biosynthesis protein CapA/YwtB (metallophosphatase superfamily)